MTRNITDIVDKDLIDLINRIDISIKENKLEIEFPYIFTPREIAERLFPGANYAAINTLISGANISYSVIGTEALTNVIVTPMPITTVHNI